MGFKCTSSIQVCALRIAKLSTAGVPVVGEESMVVTDALIKVDYKFTIKAGQKIDVENGCGGTCVTWQDDDTIDGVTLDINLCSLDDDLIVLATGATPVVIGDVVRGFAVPAVGTKLANRVSVEAWSLAWDVDAQAVEGADALYHHWVWPSVGFRLGDASLAQGAFIQPITGRGRGNPNIGNGPANDLPAGVFTSPMGHYVDDNALPTPSCGLLAVAS